MKKNPDETDAEFIQRVLEATEHESVELDGPELTLMQEHFRTKVEKP